MSGLVYRHVINSRPAAVAVRTKTQALEALRTIAAQPPAAPGPATLPPAPHEPPAVVRSTGRPGRPPAPEETMQISLRLPKAWHAALRRRAVEASASEDRTITPQEIVRRLVGQGLGFGG